MFIPFKLSCSLLPRYKVKDRFLNNHNRTLPHIFILRNIIELFLFSFIAIDFTINLTFFELHLVLSESSCFVWEDELYLPEFLN